MITFINDTDTYIVVYNNSKFSKQIPYKSKIQIDEEELNGDFELRFKYNAFEKSHPDLEFDYVKFLPKNKLDNRYSWHLEYMENFPIVTTINIKDVEVVKLSTSHKMHRIFSIKHLYLKGVDCRCHDKSYNYKKQKKMFLNLSDKLRFLKLMKKSLTIAAYIKIIIFILTTIVALSLEPDLLLVMGSLLVGVLVFGGSWFWDFFALKRARKMECENIDVDLPVDYEQYLNK